MYTKYMILFINIDMNHQGWDETDTVVPVFYMCVDGF